MCAETSDGTGINYAVRAREALGFSRRWQIAAAGVMMGLVSPYQYVWSSIQGPISNKLGIALPALGVVFTLYVVFQAGSQFPVGWWRDRHGPRGLTLLAGVLTGGGYLGLAHATQLWQLYVLYSLGAIGVGIVYTVAVNTAIKWFPDRRGLATGIGTMAFAAGSAAFVPYVRANATVAGVPTVLTNMGLLIGIGVIVGALILRDPPDDWLAGTGVEPNANDGAENEPEDDSTDDATDDSARQYEWREVIKTWQFWVLYAILVAVSSAGLTLTSTLVSFASNFGLAAFVTTISAVALPLANGSGRLVVGGISDRFKRERVMTASFLCSGIGLALVIGFAYAGIAVGFVAAVAVATAFCSPVYTLLPSVMGDYFGHEHSSTNYALLYTGKIWGGVFGGAIIGVIVSVAGWTVAFAIGGVLVAAAGLAALALRPPSPV